MPVSIPPTPTSNAFVLYQSLQLLHPILCTVLEEGFSSPPPCFGCSPFALRTRRRWTEGDAHFSQRRERFLSEVGFEMEAKSDQKSARECFSEALWNLAGQDRGERELFCAKMGQVGAKMALSWPTSRQDVAKMANMEPKMGILRAILGGSWRRFFGSWGRSCQN